MLRYNLPQHCCMLVRGSPMPTSTSATLDARISAAQEQIDAAQLLKTVRDLVRIPSVHDPARPDGNERAAADYVATLLDRWGLRYERHEVALGRPNIVVE